MKKLIKAANGFFIEHRAAFLFEIKKPGRS